MGRPERPHESTEEGATAYQIAPPGGKIAQLRIERCTHITLSK